VSVLGHVTVVAGDRAGEKASFARRQNRLLFAYLVVEHGRSVPRDELADALWGDAPPTTWEKALTVVASNVRALLAEAGVDSSVLTSAHGCYRLELPQGTWIDISEAANAIDEAEAALRRDDLATANERAGLGESLARLPFLAGENGPWVHTKRREFEDLRMRALAVLSGASLRAGDPGRAADWAEQAVELEPFRESGYRRLMEAHVAAGNGAEALRVYEHCRRLLAEELGAYPSPETEALYRQLLRQPADSEVVIGPAPLLRAPHRRRVGLVLAGAATALVAAVAAALTIGGRGSPPTVVPNSVVRIDPDTLTVTRVVPVGDAPDLVIASGGYLWVTNHILRDRGSGAPRNAGDHTLTRVDPSTGKAVVVGGGLAPCGMAADPSGDVWVANCYPRSVPSLHDDVVRVDARTLQFKATWPVAGGDGFYRGLAYGGGSLWVSEIVGGDQPNPHGVTSVDPRTGAQHVYRLADEASGLAWSAKGRDLWINNFLDGNLTVLHPATGAVQTIAAATPSPAFPVLDGAAVWVGDWGSPQVVRLHAVGRPSPRRISLPAGRFGGVWNVATGAGAVWAATPKDAALWRIDPATSKVTRIALRYAPTGVAVDPSGVWVTVRES
jgi:DNA-binding SARP family transcriptional activator/sugar lactone lactonase YvrE